MRLERNFISQNVQNISHRAQGKIPAAIQQLGDKSLGFAQTVGQFFPGNLFFSEAHKEFQ